MEEEDLEDADAEGHNPIEVAEDDAALGMEDMVAAAAAEMGVVVAEVEAVAKNGVPMKATEKAVSLCVARIGE